MCDHSSRWALAWKSLTVHVIAFNGLAPIRRPILRNLSGHFDRGTLNACLGPSGAGKTTLLKCLSGHGNNGWSHLEASSEILIGPTVSSSTSIFIDQHVHESMVNRMTVHQILQYAFAFKNSKFTVAQRESHIERTMNELMLDCLVLQNRFGECSGGEQKRIAIAQELMALSRPAFLFLDEPTTGLDSTTAFQVMKCLKSLSTRHRITVIVSIHVPNSQTLALCDQVYVLAKGGVCLYSGPPVSIGSYLQENGCTAAEETKQPPIEQLIDIACQGAVDETVKMLNSKTNESLQNWPQPNDGMLYIAKWNRRNSLTFTQLLLQTRRICRIRFLTNLSSLLLMLGLLSFCFLVLFSLPVDGSMSQGGACIPQGAFNRTCAESLRAGLLVTENLGFQMYILVFSGLIVSCSAAIWLISMRTILQNELQNGPSKAQTE